LIWLKRKNEEHAQSWKEKLEIQQRQDKKLRVEQEKRRRK